MHFFKRRITLDDVYRCWIKGSTFVGIYLLGFMCALAMIWGNLTVYTSSYLYFKVKDPGSVSTPWPISFFFSCWTIGIFSGKTLTDRLTRRLGCLVGISLMHAGYFLSYFSVQYSIVALAMTFGVLGGLGSGIITSNALSATVEWTDKYVGFTSGCRSASLTVGAAVSNQIITFYINPENLRPDVFSSVDQQSYFSQTAILDKVPNVFNVIGSISLGCSLVGLVLLRNRKDYPSISYVDNSNNGDDNDNKEEEEEYRESTQLISSRIRSQNNNHQQLNTVTAKCNACYDVGNNSDNDRIAKQAIEIRCDDINKSSCVTKQISEIDAIELDGPTSKHDYTPLEAAKTLLFYIIIFLVVASDWAFLIISAYYKQFGLIFIKNDHLMTAIGTALITSLGIFTSISGIIVDKFGLKVSLIGSFTAMANLSVFYFFTPTVGDWMFAVVTVVFAVVIYFNVTLFMIVPLKIFGETYYPTIYALTTAGGALGNFIGPPVIGVIVNSLGWFYLYLCLAVLTGLAMVLVVLAFPSV